MSPLQAKYDADEVRERTDLLSLIGQTVTLKQRSGKFVGLCPFHQEKSGSFYVDPTKGFWHCFGCGKGGDAFTFVMLSEHLTFPEAIERLAERAGVRPRAVFEAPKQKEERDLLLDANAAAAEAYRLALRGKAGAGARAYLEGRGITLAHAQRFGVGYAPGGWEALLTHLQKKGVSRDIIVKANLAIQREDGRCFDRFRNRIMVPIHDRHGRVVAFGGRAMSAEDQPKYLNTAETPIFVKGRTLYALHLAADTIAKHGRAIVTEGYFDTIACHLAGFTEAVASLGTALGEEHIKILLRLVGEGGLIYLVFDADSAGVNAALRGQALFRAAGANVRIVMLPAGEDPDTLIRKQGSAAFENCLKEALAPVEFELRQLMKKYPAGDPQARMQLFRAAAPLLQPLSPLERAEYAMWLIERWQGGNRGDLSQLEQAMLSEVAALDRRPPRQPAQQEEPARPTAPQVAEAPLEREVLTAMVQDVEFSARAVEAVPVDAFQHPGYRAIFAALRVLAQGGEAPDARRLVTQNDNAASLIASLAVRDLLPFDTMMTPDDMLDRLQEEYNKRQIQPSEIPLDDQLEAEAFTYLVFEQSERQKNRLFADRTGLWKRPHMDSELLNRLARRKKGGGPER